MTNAYPMVSLSEVADSISRPVSVTAVESYRTIGVKWWGEGAYERETINGSRTAAKTLSLVREGDLIINKIWVRRGSSAISTKAVDGCAASGEFPTFKLNQNRVVPRWIHWQTKTPDFWTKCDEFSRGTSGKNRIKPELFLTIKIPLPPLEVQRRIVARIEELSAKIEEARVLRRQAADEAGALLAGELHRRFVAEENTWPKATVGDASQIIDPNPSHRMPRYAEISIPFISTVDFEGTEGIRRRTSKYVAEETYKEQSVRCNFAVGDILYSRIGTIGEARVLTEIWPFAPSPENYKWLWPMNNRRRLFSKRHGFIGRPPEIKIGEDAPENLRHFVLEIAIELGLGPSDLREWHVPICM